MRRKEINMVNIGRHTPVSFSGPKSEKSDLKRVESADLQQLLLDEKSPENELESQNRLKKHQEREAALHKGSYVADFLGASDEEYNAILNAKDHESQAVKNWQDVFDRSEAKDNK
jgi:hypothetical protein